MTKRFSLLFVLLIAVALVVAACGGAPATEAPVAEPTQAPAAEPTEAPAAEPTEAPVEAKVFKSGQVTDVGGINDASFNELAWKGMEDAELDFGVEVNFLESQQQTDYDKNINEFLQQDYDLIVTVGFLLGDATQAAAEANPDRNFAIIDVNYLPAPNIYQSYFATDEAAFLAGYLAAGTTKTGKVGTFGGVNIPPVFIFMVGFEKGVDYYNQQHGTNVEVLGWSSEAGDGLFTGNFDSLDDGRSFAENLFDEGADIVMPVAGPVGLGTAKAAQERGMLMIGVDSDWYNSAPETKEVYLTSVLKRVDLVGYRATEAVVNGTFKGGVYDFTLENGGVQLADYHDNAGLVSAELQAELDQLQQDIISGKVSTGFAEYMGTPPAPAAEEPAADASMMMTWPEAPAADGPLAGIDPTGQTVVWWHNHSGSREEKLAAMIDKFNTENPYGITVEALNQGHYGDIDEKMKAGIVSGDLPGLVVGYQNAQASYAAVDALVDMNIYVDDPYWGLTDEEKADFSPGIYMQDVHPAFNNMRLGFPPNRSMEVLYYNKTWLEELGYDPAIMETITPDLFEEIACAAADAANGGDAQKDNEGGYIIRFDASQVAAAALAHGTEVLTEDGLGYNYDRPELVEYFTQIRNMYKNGCAWVSGERYHDAEFAARQGIFYIGSTSGLPFAQGSLDDAGNTDEWGIAPQPYTTDTPRQNLYGGSVMMPKGTPENELATWIFVKWYTSPEAQKMWVEASNYFSPRYSVAPLLTDYIAGNPKYQTALELLPYASFEPQLISYQDVRNAVNDAFQEIINTDVDIESRLADLDAQAAEIHAEATQ